MSKPNQKEAYYFSHDSNARNDDKILNLRMALGWEGYGLYWAIIEKLRDDKDFTCVKDYNVIAFDLRSDSQKIKKIIEDYRLFVFTECGKYFYSESLKERMKIKSEISQKRRESAEARWGHKEERTTAEDTIIYAVEMFNSDERFIKVGQTSMSISRRFSGKIKGYEYKVLFQKDVRQQLATECERGCDKFINYAPKINFSGHLECYNISEKEIVIDFLIAKTTFRNAKTCKVKERKVKERKVKERKVKESKGVSVLKKHTLGEFNNIHVESFDELKNEYGDLAFNWMVEKLGAWLVNKNKSVQSTRSLKAYFKNWVFNSYKEYQIKNKSNGNSKGNIGFDEALTEW